MPNACNRLRMTVLTLAVGMLLSACGNRFDDEENYKIFSYNESAGILTLDPIYSKDQPHIWVCNQLYSSLVALDDSMNIVPRLAESWTVSDDGLVYTFKLRDSVRFHDDESFDGPRYVTASDVVYSFNRVVDKSLNSPGLWIFAPVEHDGDDYSFAAIGDSLVQIRLSKPFPPFLGILTTSYASVVPHEAVDYYGDEFRRHPVGTGPFKFQYWNEGVKLVMRRSPYYFEFDNGRQLPLIDAVSVSFLIDKQVAFLEFIKGKFDFMSGIDSRYKDELLTHDGKLRKKYSDRIDLVSAPYLNTEYLSFYLEADSTLTPERARVLRRAMSMAIDRQKMICYLRNGVGEVGEGGIIPLGLPGYSKCGYGYDFAKAKSLIDNNNLKGYSITLSTTADYADLGKFVQSQVADLGIDCKMEILPPATMRSMRLNGSLELFRSSWIADYPDAENYLLLFTTHNFAPEGPNYSHYSNLRFDELYNEALLCNDMNQRQHLYSQMDSLMMDDAPVIILFYDKVLRFVDKHVEGLGINPTNLLDLRKVEIKD